MEKTSNETINTNTKYKDIKSQEALKNNPYRRTAKKLPKILDGLESNGGKGLFIVFDPNGQINIHTNDEALETLWKEELEKRFMQKMNDIDVQKKVPSLISLRTRNSKLRAIEKTKTKTTKDAAATTEAKRILLQKTESKMLDKDYRISLLKFKQEKK
jgi:hypothetical protein